MPFCSAYCIRWGSVWSDVDIITMGEEAVDAAKAASKFRLVATAQEGPRTWVIAAWAAEMNAWGWKHLWVGCGVIVEYVRVLELALRGDGSGLLGGCRVVWCDHMVRDLAVVQG